MSIDHLHTLLSDRHFATLWSRRLKIHRSRSSLDEISSLHDFSPKLSALNIATRCSRIGSFSTLLSLLKTIVGRSFGLNAGQRAAWAYWDRLSAQMRSMHH